MSRCRLKRMPIRFALRSELDCSPERAWKHATSPEGIREELRPYLRMTFPAEVAELNESTVPIGERLCRSWLLLGGVLPVEFDDVTIVELEPGRRFLERSRMASLSVWEHERVVEAAGDGASVTDRLAAEPRIALPPKLVRGIIRALFTHRHRQLGRLFGGKGSVEI